MNIDWFTFTAQIVNFLILVALLRRFLYGPIVRAMGQREAAIAERMQQAEQARRAGEAQAQEYQEQLRAIDGLRETALQTARHESAELRQELGRQAREEVQQLRQEWMRELERERSELLAELQVRSARLAEQIARRALEQLADQSLETHTLAAFASHLHDLNDERREQLRRCLSNGQETVFVRSAFEVPETWRERLRATLRDEFGFEGALDFEPAPDLICGIELEAGGYGFGWNVDEFLQNLEGKFDEWLRMRIGSRK